MTKDVMITVCGTQYDENGVAQPIEVITPGDYYFKNNKHYVIFDELIEGTGGVTRSTFKFSKDECLMKRTGAANVQMIFNTANKTVSSYLTPFGSFMIGIDTNSIDCSESEDSISVDIDYALDVNYEYLADCKLRVDIKPRGSQISLQ
ncbi:MAG: DUF1934 domain-containing protein [Lachnospiraceae bacterium]|nr:DUF1934 domain-containing protein [Lachnospiraceae bacterium]